MFNDYINDYLKEASEYYFPAGGPEKTEQLSADISTLETFLEVFRLDPAQPIKPLIKIKSYQTYFENVCLKYLQNNYLGRNNKHNVILINYA